jgi:hypothetical protein
MTRLAFWRALVVGVSRLLAARHDQTVHVPVGLRERRVLSGGKLLDARRVPPPITESLSGEVEVERALGAELREECRSGQVDWRLAADGASRV